MHFKLISIYGHNAIHFVTTQINIYNLVSTLLIPAISYFDNLTDHLQFLKKITHSSASFRTHAISYYVHILDFMFKNCNNTTFRWI